MPSVFSAQDGRRPREDEAEIDAQTLFLSSGWDSWLGIAGSCGLYPAVSPRPYAPVDGLGEGLGLGCDNWTCP